MTPAERKDIHNGIWLCQSCSKLIDSDDLRYTVDLLHKWKRLSEEATVLELETLSPAQNTEQDKALIKFYVQCFDRPAFRDDIRQEGRMEDFDRAIQDTIIALNTGVLRTRDGDIIKQAEGATLRGCSYFLYLDSKDAYILRLSVYIHSRGGTWGGQACCPPVRVWVHGSSFSHICLM